uniref:Putative glycine-rich cell wall structural protein 2 n=1 Tax=Xenopsylla cheopis TaxID=163159 RepID=A0A6M2DXG8_XENCH
MRVANSAVILLIAIGFAGVLSEESPPNTVPSDLQAPLDKDDNKPIGAIYLFNLFKIPRTNSERDIVNEDNNDIESGEGEEKGYRNILVIEAIPIRGVQINEDVTPTVENGPIIESQNPEASEVQNPEEKQENEATEVATDDSNIDAATPLPLLRAKRHHCRKCGGGYVGGGGGYPYGGGYGYGGGYSVPSKVVTVQVIPVSNYGGYGGGHGGSGYGHGGGGYPAYQPSYGGGCKGGCGGGGGGYPSNSYANSGSFSQSSSSSWSNAGSSGWGR